MNDLGALRKAAEDQGWTVERTNGSHWRWIPPDPDQGAVISGTTVSDWRATRNTLARLRRRGLQVNGHGPRKEDQEMKDMKEAKTPNVVPALEEMCRCLDCGYDHPLAEMATNPDGRPTRYCKVHMNQRRSRGRLAQIARDRERVQGAAEPPENGGAHLHVVQNGSGLDDAPEAAESAPAGSDAEMRAFVRGEVEVLLSALSDLETRVDGRLGALEHTGPPATAPVAPVVTRPLEAPASVKDEELGALITTFAQHTLWLMEFEERDLSRAEKRTLVAKAARRLAARLQPEDGA